MCDIETEQTAMKNGIFAMSKAYIHHNHWVNKKAEKDETYKKGEILLPEDLKTFNSRRKNFEQYLFEELYQGNIVQVNRGKLVIVMASYNAPWSIKQTIESLYINTYHDLI